MIGEDAVPVIDAAGLRLEELAPLLARHELAGLLLTAPEAVAHATGYPALPGSGNPILHMLRDRLPSYAWVGADGEVVLLCWGFSAEGVRFERVDRVVGYDDLPGAREALRELVRTAAAARGSVGVQASCPQDVAELVRDLVGPGRTAAVADRVLERQRLVKSAEHLELLRASAAIAEASVAALLGRLEVGMSRLELMRLARVELAQRGATGVSHLTFAFGKANPEVALGELLEPGALATLDLGAVVDGWCSDVRRYAYVGAAPDALHELHGHMVDIVDAVGALLVPGRRSSELMDAARALYATHGVEPLARFTHVGHHIGLQTEERWLDDDPDHVLEPGMAIAIELYAMTADGLQIGDEETWLVTHGAPERITHLPTAIVAVGSDQARGT